MIRFSAIAKIGSRTSDLPASQNDSSSHLPPLPKIVRTSHGVIEL